MRYSKFILPTQREIPSGCDTETQQLMVRCGMIRKVSAGLFYYLPYLTKMVQKVSNEIRLAMEEIDACEYKFPILVSKEILDKSGRWEAFGKEMFNLKDRNGVAYALSPTNEEYATLVGGMIINSYQDLPKCVYQIQQKHRDEIRPRAGVIRAREFIMKDAYSFHTDEKSLIAYYEKVKQAYVKFFNKLGLVVVPVTADNGTMGGLCSSEIMSVSKDGDAPLGFCGSCGYGANLETVECHEKPFKPYGFKGRYKKVETLNTSTIADLMNYLRMDSAKFAKSMLYKAGEKFVLAIVRGDRNVNEVKLAKLMGGVPVELASEGDIKKIGSVMGFIGPVGLRANIDIIADYEIKRMTDFVVGANEKDAHLIDVNTGDFDCVYSDIRFADENDICPQCGKPIVIKMGTELGHVFALGTRYSKKFDLNYINEKGKPEIVQMGCYGIGVDRTIAAIVEQYHDEKGLFLPTLVAPFLVDIVIVDVTQKNQVSVAENIYKKLKVAGIDTLLDDRNERAGVKFADADLLGFPVRITVGKNVNEGNVEINIRKTGEKLVLPISEAAASVKKLLTNL